MCWDGRDYISGLFMATSRNAAVTANVSGSVVGVEGGSSLRRVTSTRRAFTSGMAGVKRRSIPVQVKFQMVSFFLSTFDVLERWYKILCLPCEVILLHCLYNVTEFPAFMY